jgi:hypothetical protein
MWPFSRKTKTEKASRDSFVKETQKAYIRSLAEELLFLVPIVEDGEKRAGLFAELSSTEHEGFRVEIVSDFTDTAENILAVKGYSSAFFYINIFHAICYTRAVVSLSCKLSQSEALDRFILLLSCKFVEIAANNLTVSCNLSSQDACELLLLADRSYERYDALVSSFIDTLERG